jgi:GTP-binding protein
LKVVAAEFVSSAASVSGLPRDGLPQIAFVGRSNVGKSSLINALTGTRVARTSAAPGKTRLANLYRVRLARGPAGGVRLYLVDLPGYGYARAPRQAQRGPRSARAGREAAAREFATLAADYFASGRVSAVVLAIDARHPGLASDLEAHRWIAGTGLPFVVVATKVDRLGRAERARARAALDSTRQGPGLLVSAVTGEGMDDLWTLIARLLTPPPERPNTR